MWRGLEPAEKAFQSSPAPKSGCNELHRSTAQWTPRFQSSPAPKSGCNCRAGMRGARCSMFQSSPAPKSGCNLDGTNWDTVPYAVSILTRSEERVQPRGLGGLQYPIYVSILTRSEERVQQRQQSTSTSRQRFQSSPAPKSGCNGVKPAR